VDSFLGLVEQGRIKPQGHLPSPHEEVENTVIKARPPTQSQGFHKVRTPDLEPDWLTPVRWRLTFKGTWKVQEHICIQEARTAVELLKHLGGGGQRGEPTECWPSPTNRPCLA